MMTTDLFRHALLQFLNIPYKWGGNDPIHGLDCSGFLQWGLAMVGLDPKGDQSAQTLHDYFKDKDAKLEDGMRGHLNLLFFGTDEFNITHCAFGLGFGSMIEAGGGNSRTLTVDDAIQQGAFIRIRPVSARKDLVASIILSF